MRRKAVDKSYMEVSRLEKRLTKLTQLLMSSTMTPEQSTVGYLWSLASKKTPQRAAEQSIVEWEDDLKVLSCPFCQQEFSTYGFRRHHCRLCGRVVCADSQTGCSSKITLDVNKGLCRSYSLCHSRADILQHKTRCGEQRRWTLSSAYGCARIASILSSVERILQKNWLLCRQTSGHSET